jgi:ATP/maltotriose-dependent transcriptional regulator MalT
MGTTLAYGWFLMVKGELDAAETVFEDLRTTSAELGLDGFAVGAIVKLGRLARARGDHKRAERLLREAVRTHTSRGDRAVLPEVQAALAQVLIDVGKLEEAERLAVEARSSVVREDPLAVIATTSTLGAVRAAQGRDVEAEELLRSAFELAQETDFRVCELAPLEYLVAFLRDRGRTDEAAQYEERLAELSPSETAARVA